jgi:hypothetical protein
MDVGRVSTLAALANVLLVSWPITGDAFEVTEPEERRPRCDHYDPMRQPFFGVTHLHTGLSFDASVRFVDENAGNNPRGAYAFARGESPITLPNVIGIQGVEFPGLGLPEGLRRPTIDRPIDWGGVTDHAEHFGEMGICKDLLASPAPPGRFSLDCRMINGFYWQPFGGELSTPLTAPFNQLQRELASNAFTQLTMMNLGPVSQMTRMPLCVNDPDECDSSELAVWEEHQAAAEEYYDRSSRCSFTTFNAYEVSSTPLGTNWHRNVFFRNDRVVKRPITAIDMGVRRNESPTSGGPGGVGEPPSYVGSIVPDDPDVFPVPPGEFVTHPLPERLWNSLERDCTQGENVTDGLATRCEFLTIPHNSNLGGGAGTVPPLFFTPFNTEDARRRAAFEPLVEIYQNKGSSECRWDPRFREGVDTTDELCSFELLDTTSLTAASGVGTTGGAGAALPPSAFNERAFVRNVWKDGLELAEEQFDGVNPFKMGVVASSDSHNGTMGWHPENERFPGHLGINDAIPVQRPSTIQNSSGGHSVAWAEENSRDAIFEALKRKETYGTSGTRIVLRFFGGWSFDRSLCGKDFVPTGYAAGVPMGGDLKPRPSGASGPRFIVAAWWDDFVRTPLEQIQIIKGWYDAASGETREAVVKVVGHRGPPIDPQRRVTDTCEPKGRGSEALCTVWEDDHFDPTQRAFYYARALEVPVCRYSTLWCQKTFGLNPLDPRQCNDALARLRAGNEIERLRAEYAASCCSNQTTAPIVQPVIQERAWSSPIWYTP